MLGCPDREEINPEAGTGEDVRYQKRLIGFCSWRGINVNEFFCEICKNPGVPCPKCDGLLQEIRGTNSFKCVDCEGKFAKSKISWIRRVQQMNKSKLLSNK